MFGHMYNKVDNVAARGPFEGDEVEKPESS